MLSQNQANLDAVIGSANYDIGHVFSTGGGGIATLACVCVGGTKARGVTGNASPVGDSFWIDYVAHEMGHQFGANHTFNSGMLSCGGANRNAATAYEPGSGSTIMGYAGICGSDDLQPHSDPYFHSISFDEILAYITSGSGSGCAAVSSTGNNAPTVNAGGNYSIPASTPFLLTASGSDVNGDPLTYCWEERDLGSSTTLTAADNGSSPLFRVFNPTTNTWRTFPKLSDILNNTTTLGEKLPTTSRTMNFRVTARDNRAGGGGVNTDDMSVAIVSSAGPFAVTSQTSGGTLSNAITVTWNVANSTASPINAANVSISLSTNGGQSFPIMLLANTPNDGSQSVVLPNINTTQARLKVQGSENIFFDVNAANFTIVPGVPTPLVTVDSFMIAAEGCGPGNGAIDPGETVTVNVGLRNVGSANTTNLVATLLSGNGVTFPSSPQSYGMLAANGATVVHSYTFTATGACAGALSTVWQLQDGPTSYGSVGQNRVLGGFTNVSYSFTNTSAISIPASGNKGKGSPYPSTIAVGGASGTISKVTVTLSGLTHGYSDDVDVLLVGPNGQTVMLLSDAGGASSSGGVTLTFDNDALNTVPDTTSFTSGTYLPTDYDTASDDFPSPAPGGPYGTSLAAFVGANPNGIWSLYVQDDQQQDAGNISQGWRMTITTTQGSCCGDIVNSPPNFGPIAAKQVAELQTLTFTNSASDPNGNSLTFSLIGAPGNATIGAASGVFNWTPTETQGPATNLMQVVVTDNGSPNLSVTQSLTIVVSEVNSPPALSPVSDRTVVEGGVLTFTNTASDADVPGNALTFALLQGPSNASVHPATGVFSWTTDEFNGPGTNLIAIVATDNGSPNLSSTQTFTAIVLESNLPPTLTPIASRIVHAGAMITFTNSATDPDWPANALTFTLDPGGPLAASVDPAGVFTWLTTDGDANSTNAFTVRVTDNGLPALDSTQGFQVTVQDRPIITSITTSNDWVMLTWSAIAGETYRLQYSGDMSGTNWSDSVDILATGSNASGSSALDSSARFFRVRWLSP
jgi:subtilisin-like proprotein convertase family protein